MTSLNHLVMKMVLLHGVSYVAVVRFCCLVSVVNAGFDVVINSDDLMSCVIPIVSCSKEIFVGDKS